MDVDENLTSDDKVQVNKGKYDGQYGTITSIKANSTRKNAVLTYYVQLLGDAFPDPVPFVSKDLKKVEAFPERPEIGWSLASTGSEEEEDNGL